MTIINTEAMKTEELRKILRGKCISDESCEAAISELLDLFNVSGLLCKKKADEHARYIHGKGYDNEECATAVYQTKLDYIAGFKTASGIE